MSDSLLHYLRSQKIDPAPILSRLEQVDHPLCRWLQQQLGEKKRPLLVGINGAQGTGKSTFSKRLQILLREERSLQSMTLSLDDYYLGKSARRVLSERVHPLLQRRGVPGTHDLVRLNHQLERLFRIQADEQIALSCFDKASDESADERMWRCPPQGLDLILFEGWCVGVPPQPVEALVQPINSLEVRLDPDRQWRHFVNEQLAGAYRTLFSRMDVLLVLQAPGMASVVEWRALQEEKMRALQGGGMTPDQVVDFVRYFERLTRHMLVEMPQLADVLLPVGEDHQLDSIHLCQELNPCC